MESLKSLDKVRKGEAPQMKDVFHFVLSLRRLFSHCCIFDLNKQSVSTLKNQYFVVSLR